MVTANEYRDLAQTHRRLATEAVTSELRVTYERVALAYEQLADQIERLETLGLRPAQKG